MFESLKQLIGLSPEPDYSELMISGAQIIDVRSEGEFQGGHIQGSLNLPLPTLEHNLSKIKKGKAVITCCASGMRSATAKQILESRGYGPVVNGGGWSSLARKLNRP